MVYDEYENPEDLELLEEDTEVSAVRIYHLEPALKWWRNLTFLLAALALGAGGYALSLIDPWMWLLAAPMLFYSLSFLYFALTRKYCTCPFCDLETSVNAFKNWQKCTCCGIEFPVKNEYVKGFPGT
jgi:hypothetical protein